MLGVDLTVKSLGNHVVSPGEEEEERLEWEGLQKKQDLSLEWKRVGDEKLIILSVVVRVQHANHSATEPPFTVCIILSIPKPSSGFFGASSIRELPPGGLGVTAGRP